MTVLTEEATLPQATARIFTLPPDVLAADEEAARLVARLQRKPVEDNEEPVRVAAFNSYI